MAAVPLTTSRFGVTARCWIAAVLALFSIGCAAKNTYDEWQRLAPPGADMFTDHELKKKDLDEESRRELLAMKAQRVDMDKERLASTASGYIRIFAVWSLFPVAAAAGVFFLRSRPGSGTCYALSWVYAAIYGLYAINGPSDPLGSGHMHLVIIPVLSAIVWIPVVMAGMIGLRRKDPAAEDARK